MNALPAEVAEPSVQHARLILASASPRRKSLLATLEIAFDVMASPFEEPSERPQQVSVSAWAASLAHFKARSVFEAEPDAWVLGADTVVACAGDMLGKPRDRGDARRMLEMQARHPSDVITGICLLRPRGARQICAQRTRVWMHDDEDERERYLAGEDWRGKAGAYGIQDVGDRLVARIQGDFDNVVGLPMARVRTWLSGQPVGRRGAETQS